MNSGNSTGTAPKGKILRVKLGYNPNSSSIGSMIFALPVAMLSAAVAFGTVSGQIFSAFAKGKKVTDSEKSPGSETQSPSSDVPE